jgi:hypothetical protein
MLEAASCDIDLCSNFQSHTTANETKSANLIHIPLFLRLVLYKCVAHLGGTRSAMDVCHVEQTLSKAVLMAIARHVAIVTKSIHKHRPLRSTVR